MSAADTPAPAVPLDGRFCSVCGIAHSWKRHDGSAADEIRAALQDAAAMAAARADRQDRYSPDNWHALMLHCEAADKRLSGLLADAARWDWMEAHAPWCEFDPAECITELTRISGLNDRLFEVLGNGPTMRAAVDDAMAAARALPEGGL